MTTITAKKLASCMNSLQHGAQSKTLFLKEEDPSAFFSLLKNAFEQYQPAFDHDAALISRCIEDHWLLLRRERTVNSFELSLHNRLPDPTDWLPEDLHKMNLLDRYKTQASRSYQRSLKNVQTIQKIARDEQRWQHQFEKEKQNFALQLERWELTKAKQAAKDAAVSMDEPLPDPPFEPEPVNKQTLYIGNEDGAAVHYETTPTNKQLRQRITPNDTIVRVYNFVGGVPTEFEHLITKDMWSEGASSSIQKTYTFAEWDALTKQEQR